MDQKHMTESLTSEQQVMVTQEPDGMRELINEELATVYGGSVAASEPIFPPWGWGWGGRWPWGWGWGGRWPWGWGWGGRWPWGWGWGWGR